MEYFILADTYEELEYVSAKLKKRDVLANLLKKTPSGFLPQVVLLSAGRVFPSWSQQEIGIADKMMIKAIAKATGFKDDDVVQNFKKTGDLGLTAEKFIKERKQAALFRKKLTVDKVFQNIRQLASVTGEGSQDRKLNLIAELLVSANPKEARYIVRTILETLRIGVAEGIIRDAISVAFNVENSYVGHAWNLLSDYGEVAKIAKEKGNNGLKRVNIQLGKPIQVMLGEKAENIEEVVQKYGKVIAEYKFDGARLQCHKKDDKIWLYTRRLDDVTKQFPDVVDLCKNGLKAKECIVEGEVLGVDLKSGVPLPFQILSQRIHRKYDINKMVKEIPVQVNLFDVMYVDEETLFDKPLKERRKILEKMVKEISGKFQLTKCIISDDVKELNKFYQEALKEKQEGLFLKVLDSHYIFGRHVGGWYKIKPIMETLDLVIISATWGTGIRAKWLSSYELACRDPDTGKFLSCGMMGTGLTEEEFQLMTEVLKPLVISEKGREVKLKPKVVVEVAFQEIQKSPNYMSGIALRFPKLKRIREDKGSDDADTIDRVRRLYKSQGKVG